MKRFSLALAASLVIFSGCDGFREAMTAHVDTVARAGTQELTVERMAELMGTSKVPLTPEAAKLIANVWVNYQLLGLAAANGDSLNDPEIVDEVMWPVLAQQRANKWNEQVRKSWALDTSLSEATYMSGSVLGVQHILFAVPEQGLSQGKQDSVQHLAEQVAKQATAGNFADLVTKYSMDPGSKDQGGFYMVPRGSFVPEFEKAAFDLRPGEITRTPVRTQFGWHIIRRVPFDEIASAHAAEFASMLAQATTQAAESTYMAKLEASGEIEYEDGAAAEIKEVMQAPDEHRHDNTLIAKSRAGDFTSAQLSRWITAYPVRQQQTLRAQAAAAPDSILLDFVRQQFIRGDLLLAQADSAKIELSPAELADARNQFASLVYSIYAELGLLPGDLADSAKATAQRERIAAEIVERYMDKLLQEQTRYVDIPNSVSDYVRDKYEYDVHQAGLDHAVERAQLIRSAADSVRQSQQPKSQVPLGAPPAGADTSRSAAPQKQPAQTPPPAPQR